MTLKIITIKVICILSILSRLSLSKDILVQPIRHVLQITDLSLKINETVGKLIHLDHKHYMDKEIIDMDLIIYDNFLLYYGRIDLIKCKEYFLNCIIWKSYDISNLCENVTRLLHFVKIGYINREIRCPFRGEYNFKNITFDKDTILPTIFGPLDKSWDFNSIKLNIKIFNIDHFVLLFGNGNAKILSYRSKKN
ncbi:uncharacterized protein LOC126899041 [Daktulosphaira vitifoliae]|uniref:uncharacterized protein LOC126899041 n=1 Tax=Daktulosphaira vitifoliae TaxID=58002 RepID=UPI0021AA3B7E|nr:uncharacterized protein LOC126899041 [Daktulosphaira vitifoliae]